MADKKGKWVTIKGRHIFIPEGKKLEDVWDYGQDEEHYEEDLGESIYEGKHGTVHLNEDNEYEIRDNRGNKISNTFSTDREAIKFLENDYEDDDYEDDFDWDKLEKQAKENRIKEERAKLDKLYPRRGDEKIEKEIDSLLNNTNHNDLSKDEFSKTMSGYKNQKNMSEDDFKKQYPEYEKGKGGYEYWTGMGDHHGYTLLDKEGKTIGFYDKNTNKFYYDMEPNNKSLRVNENQIVMKTNNTKPFIESVQKGNFDQRYKNTVKELSKIPDKAIDQALEKIANEKDYFKRNELIGKEVSSIVDTYLKDSPAPYPNSGYNIALSELLEEGVKNMTSNNFEDERKAIRSENYNANENEIKAADEIKKNRDKHEQRIFEGTNKLASFAMSNKKDPKAIQELLKDYSQDEVSEIIANFLERNK